MTAADDPAYPASNRAKALDPELRNRVDDAIAEFQECYNTAAVQPDTQHLRALHEATDRLIRAASRVLIELDRA